MKNSSKPIYKAGLLTFLSAAFVSVAFIFPFDLIKQTPQRAQKTGLKPDTTRFSYSMLASGFDEPMQMAILPDYSVIVAERKGAVKLYDAIAKSVRTLAHFNVFSGIEDGLLGVALDPDFEKNNWVYFYNSVGGERSISELARYEFREGSLDFSSKKVLLEVPTQRIYCCHSAGHLVFDKQGLLYLSIGDNTNAEEIEGHNPTDERPGRHLSDGQASSANSNDFRGKIIRIRPEKDGTYSIPDGNLFPKDGSQGKPEIYVMGCRNPFRISIDSKTGYLYWGDVGPDTEVPAREGKLSYDEINQARKPGFFGYPYFLGENEAFPKYDFETKKEGPGQDPAHPVNNSPHNTGIRQLPPAQPAFIWYGKGPSERWPLVGKGGASAMAGPVYHSDNFPDAPYKLPPYYDGKLFIYEWIRKWIMVVTMDENGDYVSMEPFLPGIKPVAPIDMTFAPDGALYILAYGTTWFAPNADAGIIRIEYNEGNRNPVATASASTNVGAIPLNVSFSAEESRDFDPDDKLSYSWLIDGRTYTGKTLKHTFSRPGVYPVVLTVADNQGGSSTASLEIKAGNTPPDISIQSPGNKSFYWDDETLPYQISVRDKEDRSIDRRNLQTGFEYVDFAKDLASVLSSPGEGVKHAKTQEFYATLDCKSCHQKDTRSIGPSLSEIAKRYHDTPGASDLLASKIIDGGAGNWGTYPMPPHPTLTREEANRLSGYILDLAAIHENIPLKGEVSFIRHRQENENGAYVLFASYTDNGANGIGPLRSASHLVLRHPRFQIEDYEEGNAGVVVATAMTGFNSYITHLNNSKYVRFSGIDLTAIRQVRFRVLTNGAGGKIVMRSNARTGNVLGEIAIPAGSDNDVKTGWKEFLMPVRTNTGIHDLFFTFENTESKGGFFQIDWMQFER